MSFLKKLNLELKPCLCIPVGENLLPCFPEDFPGGASGKESTCQCRTHKSCGFDPWVGKIPWRKAWQPTLVFLPGESLGQMSLVGYSPWGCKDGVAKSWTWLKWLSRHTCVSKVKLRISKWVNPSPAQVLRIPNSPSLYRPRGSFRRKRPVIHVNCGLSRFKQKLQFEHKWLLQLPHQNGDEEEQLSRAPGMYFSPKPWISLGQDRAHLGFHAALHGGGRNVVSEVSPLSLQLQSCSREN